MEALFVPPPRPRPPAPPRAATRQTRRRPQAVGVNGLGQKRDRAHGMDG